MTELYILGALVLAWACAPHKAKRKTERQPAAKAADRPRTVSDGGSRTGTKVINLAQIEAMEDQINAACELGIALDNRSRAERDAVKRARLAQQSANAYARAASIQARIDKMTMTA